MRIAARFGRMSQCERSLRRQNQRCVKRLSTRAIEVPVRPQHLHDERVCPRRITIAQRKHRVQHTRVRHLIVAAELHLPSRDLIEPRRRAPRT